MLCEEPRPAYDRVHLSEFFARARSAEDLSLVAGRVSSISGMTCVLKLNARATAIDTGTAKTVTASAPARCWPYDKLVIASGSSPFVPPVPGKDRKDCFVYRTIEDLEAMARMWSAAPRAGVVIGGGLLGLECAKALRDMNLANARGRVCAAA